MTIQKWNGAVRGRVLTISALFLASNFCPSGRGEELYCQVKYTVCAVPNGGTISGKVSLKGKIPACDRMEISQDGKVCGRLKSSPRLCVWKDGGVGETIVYIEGVSKGKSFPSDDVYQLEQHHCEYNPHLLIVPAGKCLQIVNNDQVLHNVHAYQTAEESKTVFNIAQPIKGVKSKTRALMDPGLIRVSCDAGHPWMSAHVMVAEHPYYTITDKNGNYSLCDVPPGEYTIRLWHEGVAIANRSMEHGKVKNYEFEPPYEESRRVTVTAKTTSTADFQLSLR
jgi:plastocyanin